MKLIKLNAIDSTSSFLKDLAKKSTLENYTVVVSDKQSKGRGQQKNSWISEPYKNLTMSIFIKGFDLEISNQKYLNFAISLAVFELISEAKIESLSIKWPNDILAVNKKLCGILIENNIRKKNIHSTIVGIGLNVNQENFPSYLENATSLKKLSNKNFDLNTLTSQLIEKVKEKIQLLSIKKYELLEKDYLSVLYKINIPAMFKDISNTLFMGKIVGISETGNLLIELEDETIKEFGIKEISLA